MEWVQFVTFMLTVFGFFAFMRSETKEWRAEHKIDIEKMDEKWVKMEEKMDKKCMEMDAKWERLFELFISKIKS